LSRPGFERRYQALSYEFRVRTGIPEVAEHLDRLLAWFRASGANGAPAYWIRRGSKGRPRFAVYLSGRCVQRTDTAGAVLDFVLWSVTSQAVQRTEDYLVLHAGAASWKGLGLLLPAPPDSGKTTLSAALTRAGFSYLTDEAALIDPRTAILHPFPRALWMDSKTLDLIPQLWDSLPSDLRTAGRPQHHIVPEALRPRAVGKPCPVRFVVAPSYARRAPTALEPLSRSEALVTLAENSFNFGRFGAQGLGVLRDVVRGADCYRLRTGDLDSAVTVLTGLVRRSAR
jgi:hypothetical protein